jgi:glutamyl-tRNA reductase
VSLRVSLLVIGCSHRSADLSLLERLAVPVDELPKVLRSLTDLEHVSEAAVLSTCNRVEVYASVTKFHPGLHELHGWLSQRGDIHPQDLDVLQYNLHDDRAAAHLFAVAGGLDSMVVGERRSRCRSSSRWRSHALRARPAGSCSGSSTRRSTSVAASARRQRSPRVRRRWWTSGLEAVQRRRGGPLTGQRVALVGAGKMGRSPLTGSWNSRRRTSMSGTAATDKAERLAARVGGSVVAADALADTIAAADVVICTTGAAEPVIDVDMVERAMAGRGPDRPLVLLDLAVPRNVDRACADLDGSRSSTSPPCANSSTVGRPARCSPRRVRSSTTKRPVPRLDPGQPHRAHDPRPAVTRRSRSARTSTTAWRRSSPRSTTGSAKRSTR